MLFDYLPPFARDCAATLWGLRLRWQRRGRFFKSELDEYRRRQAWSLDEWRSYQDQRLHTLLRRAVTKVPYYRDLYSQGRFPIEKVKTIEDLRYLPILEKEQLREMPKRFLVDELSSWGLYKTRTSGSTGKPVTLYWDSKMSQSWNACFHFRVLEQSGIRAGVNWAMLGGRKVTPFSQSKPPFWIWNAVDRQLYMSVYHMKDEWLGHYIDELKKRQIEYLFGYASAMYSLASYAIRMGRSDLKIPFAISNAEPFYPYQREALTRAFGCRTIDTYAPSELTGGAFECPEGKMHVAPDVGVFEVIDSHGSPAQSGELVLTSLMNFSHILIRYRQGDCATLSNTERCSCGLQTPIIEKIEGRRDDVLRTRDGREIFWLQPVFRSSENIIEAQIIQKDWDRLLIKIVPGSDFSEADSKVMARELRARMGENIAIDFECVEAIPRGAAGKFRSVINELKNYGRA